MSKEIVLELLVIANEDESLLDALLEANKLPLPLVSESGERIGTVHTLRKESGKVIGAAAAKISIAPSELFGFPVIFRNQETP